MNLFKYMRLFSVLVFFTATTYAQQETVLNFYRYNLNIINPAHAGVVPEFLITSGIRNQWSGVADAPQTQAVTMSTPMGSRVGMGVSLLNDRTFIERSTNLMLDFSYHLPLKENLDLFLGLKAGGNFFDINAAALESYNPVDDAVLRNVSSFQPNVGVGFYLKGKQFYVSVSSPRMLSTERIRREDGVATVLTDKMHLYFSAGYDWTIDPLWTLKSSALIRSVAGAAIVSDYNLIMNYAERFEIGGGYRSNYTFSAMASVILSRRLQVGYAYENETLRNGFGINASTHEFFVRFSVWQYQ